LDELLKVGRTLDQHNFAGWPDVRFQQVSSARGRGSERGLGDRDGDAGAADPRRAASVLLLFRITGRLHPDVATMSHSEALSRLPVGDRRRDMIRWALRGAIDKFERDGDCDASYMRDMIDASPRFAWLLSRVTDLLAAGPVVGGVGLAAPAAANVQPAAASVYTMSPGRIGAIVAAVVGLIGMALGGLALVRSRRTA